MLTISWDAMEATVRFEESCSDLASFLGRLGTFRLWQQTYVIRIDCFNEKMPS